MAEKIQIMGSTPVEEEPLYGLTYLPRKFKATFVILDILSSSCQTLLLLLGCNATGHFHEPGGRSHSTQQRCGLVCALRRPGSSVQMSNVQNLGWLIIVRDYTH